LLAREQNLFARVLRHVPCYSEPRMTWTARLAAFLFAGGSLVACTNSPPPGVNGSPDHCSQPDGAACTYAGDDAGEADAAASDATAPDAGTD
jgi:hypothetical protein